MPVIAEVLKWALWTGMDHNLTQIPVQFKFQEKINKIFTYAQKAKNEHFLCKIIFFKFCWLSFLGKISHSNLKQCAELTEGLNLPLPGQYNIIYIQYTVLNIVSAKSEKMLIFFKVTKAEAKC